LYWELKTKNQKQNQKQKSKTKTRTRTRTKTRTRTRTNKETKKQTNKRDINTLYSDTYNIGVKLYRYYSCFLHISLRYNYSLYVRKI
jgi:hypothetical protein